ncbi:MAG: DUF302 domain-containing protein [Gammaproteobacteria bacterium]|jgi:uncharacterized protein (DUF302 family)|nr:DUF302 domain-containing protein [Gammaproteobacteria bacterium]NNJ72329.1 DUF302 domain-containing protein [Enterobacterales bacterium]
MSYSFSTTVKGDFDSVENLVREKLQDRGFGVLTEIDVSATLKKKIDKDLHPYKILGACNPGFAYQAILAEEKIGVMLPCNVLLQEKNLDEIEVSAVDPMASMQAIQSEELGQVANEVQGLLRQVILDISQLDL